MSSVLLLSLFPIFSCLELSQECQSLKSSIHNSVESLGREELPDFSQISETQLKECDTLEAWLSIQLLQILSMGSEDTPSISEKLAKLPGAALSLLEVAGVVHPDSWPILELLSMITLKWDVQRGVENLNVDQITLLQMLWTFLQEKAPPQYTILASILEGMGLSPDSDFLTENQNFMLATLQFAAAETVQCFGRRGNSPAKTKFLDFLKNGWSLLGLKSSNSSFLDLIQQPWPIFPFLHRLKLGGGLQNLPHSEEESQILVSWSSDEAAHLGGNFAEKLAILLAAKKQASPFHFSTLPDVSCADVWIFRGAAPRNFEGISIFVDGEATWGNEGLHSMPSYPYAMYLGPDAENFKTSLTFGGASHEVQKSISTPPPFEPPFAPQKATSSSVYLPFGVSSFLQRERSSPWDLRRTRGTADYPSIERHYPEHRDKLAVFLSYNCKPKVRKHFVAALSSAFMELGLPEVDTPSRCRRGESGWSEEETQSLPEERRYGKSMYDDSVDIMSKYKFSVVFENRLTEGGGYVTEKIMSAFLAQSVPIYYGDGAAAKLFNPDAFIWVNQYPSWEKVLEIVVRMALVPSLWKRMVIAPVFRSRGRKLIRA